MNGSHGHRNRFCATSCIGAINASICLHGWYARYFLQTESTLVKKKRSLKWTAKAVSEIMPLRSEYTITAARGRAEDETFI